MSSRCFGYQIAFGSEEYLGTKSQNVPHTGQEDCAATFVYLPDETTVLRRQW